MMQQPGIQRIAQQIVDAFNPRRITLFGSRARGDARPDSDVDLMIEMESDQRPQERMRRVYRVCRDRVLPLDVLVFTPDELSQQRQYRYSVVHEIERDGRVLYEQPR